MEDNNFLSKKSKYALILLIIDDFPNFSNSYDLNKILSWNFGIINLFELSSTLIKKDLILIKDEKKLNREYIITKKGKEYLEKQITELKLELNERFQNKKEIISSFLRKRGI